MGAAILPNHFATPEIQRIKSKYTRHQNSNWLAYYTGHFLATNRTCRKIAGMFLVSLGKVLLLDASRGTRIRCHFKFPGVIQCDIPRKTLTKYIRYQGVSKWFFLPNKHRVEIQRRTEYFTTNRCVYYCSGCTRCCFLLILINTKTKQKRILGWIFTT